MAVNVDGNEKCVSLTTHPDLSAFYENQGEVYDPNCEFLRLQQKEIKSPGKIQKHLSMQENPNDYVHRSQSQYGPMLENQFNPVALQKSMSLFERPKRQIDWFADQVDDTGHRQDQVIEQHKMSIGLMTVKMEINEYKSYL